VRIRFQPWQLALLIMLLCAAAVGITRWARISKPFSAERLIAALPGERAAILYIDAAVLRESGLLDLLAGSKAAEEPDYRRFVDQTGFDYRTDLDAVAAAFINGNVYMTVRGRFQWKQLTTYAATQGGACRYSVCTMPGSTRERNISFYPLKADVLALAVAPEPRGVTAISPDQWKNHPALPPEPVWISAPGSVFSRNESLPQSARTLLEPLAQARKVTLAAGADGLKLRLRLDVLCPSPDSAAKLAGELSRATTAIKSLVDEARGDAGDLGVLLASGHFEQHQDEVTGTWPLDRRMVEALAGGAAQ
jgi:hypothetical protein